MPKKRGRPPKNETVKSKPKSALPPKDKIDFTKVSLIIPCYWVNRDLAEATELCLLSLAENTNKLPEVIIVNDGSPEGIEPDGYFVGRGEATVLDLPQNEGYTRAVNIGLENATGDVLIVGNNDILFQANWLEAILEPLKQGYGVSSIATIEKGRKTELSQMITADSKFGCLFAITREVYEKVGALDEDLGRGYFTDLDYHKRVTDAGYKVGKNHAAAVQHLSRSTFKVVDPEGKYYTEAKVAFEKKWNLNKG